MRPIRLELEGFTAFREFTVVDFEGADLFVLTGPTGSGKSSLIDAITFALYGSVPRYQNPNLVKPVVSQGKVEARVRFDFAVGDVRYTAVRVVRKTARGGATTKEARLESGDLVIAGAADEVSAQVRRILGLSFEQFTTCVVLPQGEFARFLHEKPAQRQDLLTKLLGVEIYERMGNLARAREAEARQRALLLLEEERGRLEEETTDKLREATRRKTSLRRLVNEIEEAAPRLERLEAAFRAEREDAERFEKDATLLESVVAPEGLATLHESLGESRARIEAARKRREEADERLHSAEERVAALPDASVLERALADYRDRDERLASLDAARDEEEKARGSLAEFDAARAEAARELRSAEEAADAARRELAAHDLASHLERGQPCPVCRRKVQTLPSLSLPAALADAETALANARAALDTAERAHRKGEQSFARVNERVRGIESELAVVGKRLEDKGAVEDISTQRRELAAAGDALDEAKKESRRAREEEAAARRTLEKLALEESNEWSRFEARRDAVASLAPPPTDRESLLDAWSTLSSWAREQETTRLSRGLAAATAAKASAEEKDALLETIRETALEVGVELDPERPRDRAVTKLAAAEQEEARIRTAIERRSALEERGEQERERARVAGALGLHLRASGFERWLLEAAFERLVSGATGVLNELSSGQYSFEYDDNLNFEVVDHRNADEKRSARTLSGGETFLASLALALTLAEQTADLAAGGSARLESLFLDEGFGTLDDDTLEVVAAAIEELGAKGRVVGLVTHQQSLAEKIPVRFVVSKGPVTATVERQS